MSYKLKFYVLYIETFKERYEIARSEQQMEGEDQELFNDWDQYRFSRVLNPLICDNAYMEESPRPLPADKVEVVYSDIFWDKFLWGSNALQVKDILIEGLKSFKYYPISIVLK